MSAKDMAIDFINLVFLLILTGFCIFFFIAGDRFENFTILLKSLVPLAFVGIIFIIKLKLNRRELKKRKYENNLDIVLHLTFMDKLQSDIISFLIPAVILGVPLLMQEGLSLSHIFQALLAFLIFYLWQKRLFKKT